MVLVAGWSFDASALLPCKVLQSLLWALFQRIASLVTTLHVTHGVRNSLQGARGKAEAGNHLSGPPQKPLLALTRVLSRFKLVTFFHPPA